MKRITLGVVLSAGLAGATVVARQAAPPPAASSQQQPPVTFRAEVNYVEVDVRVLDAQGRFVTDLTAADFQVFEDGKPQQVTVFSMVDIPVERATRPLFAQHPIEPDVQSNVRGYNGRIWVFVLDDLHVHPLRSATVKAAARLFIERSFGANDVGAVIHLGGAANASQEFTNNPRLLLASIDRFMGRKVRSSVLERIDEEARTRELRQQGDRIEDPSDPERGYQARNALDSLKNLAQYLGGISGRRKAVVLFSEGIDYDITDVFNNRQASTVIDATREAIGAATRGNVAIYGVDPRGLGAGTDDLIGVQSFPDDTTLGLGPTAFYNEVRLGQDSLRVLAEETGGLAVVNRNDLARAFEEIVSDNSSYYVLGYYPQNERRDGRFRRIEVRVNRPGLTVRARRGYQAPRGRPQDPPRAGPSDASPELRDAMTSPLPVSALPMATTAAAFKGPAPNAAVVVSTLLAGPAIPLAEKNGTFHNELEVVASAVNQSGKIFGGDRHTINLTLKPDTAARARAAGIRVVTQLDLPPGRYQLRVAAREGNARRAGSVLYDLEVPDFTKEPLTMSGLALTSLSSGLVPTVRPKDPLATLLPGPLTSYREFGQNDELALFVEIYDNAVAQPHKVDIVATLKAEGGQTVFQTREERDSSELAGSSGGYGFAARIPLSGVAPGLYVLRVEAQSRLGDRPAVAREVIVRVSAPAQAPPPHP
ncbi:MAG: VWA domain-containing protein [Acidobacteriota bacterium]